MTDVDDILNNATQWTTEGVTKPTIKTGQLRGIDTMTRGIVVKRLHDDDELIGVLDRNRYSVDSHEVWRCAIVTMTSMDDLDNIRNCVKRICAEYTFTDDENHLEWQGGDFVHFNNVRFAYYFAIIKKKSMVAEF